MSPFRSIEVSDLAFDPKHLRFITVKSPALQRRGDITVFTSPGCESLNGVPLLLLLHGVYGSHWAWAMKGGAHCAASTLVARRRLRPLVIAMPSDGLWGDGSGYLPHGDEDSEKWIVNDVPTAVREVFACVDETSPLFICGLSMGGYGALRLGSKYAERFSGISAHSAITRPEHFSRFVDEPVSEYVCAPAEDLDLLYWMKKRRTHLPSLRFDCGLLDSLLEPNRELHEALTAENIPHTYDEFPGEHSWPYWQEHIYDTLLFVEAVCRRKPRASFEIQQK